MQTRKVTVQYRYLNLESLFPEFVLKDVVVDVLRRIPRSGGTALSTYARSRKIDLDQDGSFVVLNKMSDAMSWDGPAFCGQLIHLKSGAELPGITGSLDEDVAEYELQNLTFEQQLQFLQGELYFAIVGNHVGLIEGQRTRGRTLERYLARLLQGAGEMEIGTKFSLNVKLNGNVSKVSEIEFKSRPTRAKQDSLSDAERSRDVAEEDSKGATVIEVLRLLGWQDEQLNGLQDNLSEGGYLEGVYKVMIKGHRRAKSSVDRAVLEEALRNLDPKSIGLLGDGAREKGGLIKLSQEAHIPVAGDLLDSASAMTTIVETLKKWARAGKIDCTF